MTIKKMLKKRVFEAPAPSYYGVGSFNIQRISEKVWVWCGLTVQTWNEI